MQDGVTLSNNKPISNHSDKTSTNICDIQLIGFGEILCHVNWVVCEGISAVWNKKEVNTILVLDRADLQRHIVSHGLIIQGKFSDIAHLRRIDLDKFVLVVFLVIKIDKCMTS